MRDILDRWRLRRETYRNDGALVSGERIAEQVVADLEAALQDTPESALVSLAEAGRLCGYRPDTLRRKIDAGELRDYGTPHRPRVRVGELPRKVDCLLNSDADASIEESRRRTALGLISAA
jgi:hypothetical protein